MHSTKLSHTPINGSEKELLTTMVLYHSAFRLSTGFENILIRNLEGLESDNFVSFQPIFQMFDNGSQSVQIGLCESADQRAVHI